VRAEVDFGALQYTAHAKVAIPTAGDQVVPWMQFGLGSYALELKVDTDLLGSDSDSETCLGFNLGAGVDFAVSPRVRLGGGVAYHRIQSDDDLGTDATVVALGARLCFDFGR
jgi:opacity protein-like surface antigen